MANDCTGRVIIYADDTIREEMFAHICSEKSEFDFEKVIPMPEYIDRTAIKDIEDFANKNKWYAWSIENWGTTWNAYEVMVDEDCGQIDFLTAWCSCSPVIDALSKQFPEAAILYIYEEISEDMWGEELYYGGKLINERTGKWSDDSYWKCPYDYWTKILEAHGCPYADMAS